jgi:hypothetical protein
MEEEISKINNVTDKKNSINFDETFDYKPLKKGFVEGLQESVFKIMRGKKAVVAPKKVVAAKPQDGIPYTPLQTLPLAIPQEYRIPVGYTITNGLLIKKKTIFEKARDQLKFPISNKSDNIINGISLVAFCIGSYILYSALPTRPELVIGIILVSIAGNILISKR